MKQRLLLLTFLVVSVTGMGQTHQAEINEHVWKPFTKAIMTQDVNRFAALHSNDLVRAEINRKKVMDLEEYKRGMEKSWPSWKESIQKNNTHYTFELRFIERICNGAVAYEIGYFKNETINAAGEKQESFGKFHVVLRKESGTWKIVVDSDSNEGNTITSDMFMAAAPMEQQ